MKILLTLILLAFSLTSLYSQTTDAEKNLKVQKSDSTKGWENGGAISVNLTQVSLTNWAGGGVNSIATSGLINLFANYSTGESLWENYLDIGYGTINQGDDNNWLKTDDKIDFTSKYGQKAFKNLYYAALLNFKTQMTAGFKSLGDTNEISNFLAPAYVLGAIGMDYNNGDNFTVFFAPVTTKFTIVNDQTLADQGAFGVEKAVLDSTGKVITPGENSRMELGGYLRLFYKRNLMENIDFQTKLDLFSNYVDNPLNIDISWEVLISMKVNKYISANLSTHLLYDDDIKFVDTNGDGTLNGVRTQFKEVLGIGFSYQF